MKRLAIHINEIDFAYSTFPNLFNKFSMQVEEGSFWGVLGQNGAGKSTLLELINGVKTPQKGTITFSDFVTNPYSQQYLISHVSASAYMRTVGEFLKYHSAFFPNHSQQELDRLIDIFRVNLNQRMNSLSTGKLKQVQAIAAFATKPKVLLIDEITAVLDPDARTAFFKTITEYHQQGMTILLATNIKEDLQGRITNLLYLKEDKIEITSSDELKGVL